MNYKWKDIREEKPKDNQEVYYYFDFFDKVYRGIYNLEDISDIYKKDKGTYFSDCFSDKGGWLCDDIQFWMPIYDNNFPNKPNVEICKQYKRSKE